MTDTKLTCDWCDAPTEPDTHTTDCRYGEYLCDPCRELHDTECEETARKIANEERGAW